MLALKVVAILVASACGILSAALGQGKDTWGARHHGFFRTFVALSLIAAATLIGLTIVDYHQSKEASADRDALLEEVRRLGNQLSPFIETASTLFPDIQKEEALKLLASQVESLEERTAVLELQPFFQPLDVSLRGAIVEQLRAAKDEVGEGTTKIHIKCEGGSTVRQELGEEIASMLDEAGFVTTGPATQISFGTGPLPPVSLKVNPSCEQLANEIYRALRLLLKTEFRGLTSGEEDGCYVVLVIHGDPLFSEDGTVEFR